MESSITHNSHSSSPKLDPATAERLRRQATRIALTGSIFLTLFKLFVGYVSGSIGVLGEALHSSLDILAAAVAFFAVRAAIQPADANHAYGHGKIETISTLFESTLLLVVAGVIVLEGIERLSNLKPIQHEELTLAVMGVSTGVSYWIYRHNMKIAVLTGSSAIRINSLHYFSDVVTAGGVLAGLILIYFTDWLVVDPIVAFLLAGYICYIAVTHLKDALAELTDEALPEEEVSLILSAINRFKERFVRIDSLRTRKAGAQRHIDFNLIVRGALSVQEAHDLCDEIEEVIDHLFSDCSVRIHVEPEVESVE